MTEDAQRVVPIVVRYTDGSRRTRCCIRREGRVDLDLHGQKVSHLSFGTGEIVEVSNGIASVYFEDMGVQKKFLYPQAFGSFLELEDESLRELVEEEKHTFLLKEAEQRLIADEKADSDHAKTAVKRTIHSSHSAAMAAMTQNIAFKCNYCDGGRSEDVVGFQGVCCDETIRYNIKIAKHIWCSQPENRCHSYLRGESTREELDAFYESTKTQFSKSVCYECQMLLTWIAGAGITQNGDRQGKPMTLRNAKANSLAVLTTKLPSAEESDRFIFAVFLIDENYEGDTNEEGYVHANPAYRIQLSPDEARGLKFWDFYFNPAKPEKIVFGSGLHRYLTDIQAAQILTKVCRIKSGTPEEELSTKMLTQFLRVKDVDPDDIPSPNGAYYRIIN
jgi:hypothetical protein